MKCSPRVPPLWTAPTTAHPSLANKQHNGHDCPVGDERAAHNIMCQTLSQMAAPAVPSERRRAEQELHPTQHRIRLANHAVQSDHPWPQRLFVYMQLEVYPETQLREDGHNQDIRIRAVHCFEELSAVVLMPKKVAAQRQHEAGGLQQVSQQSICSLSGTADSPARGHASGCGICPIPFR